MALACDFEAAKEPPERSNKIVSSNAPAMMTFSQQDIYPILVRGTARRTALTLENWVELEKL